MKRSNILLHRALGSAAAIAAILLPQTLPAQQPAGSAAEAHATHALLRIPASIRAEHEEIHRALVAATKEPGAVGVAARELAAVLHPHFVREEQIALPPLGLLAPLARGDRDRAMREVLPLTDSLRAELPRMMQEHKSMHAATTRLAEVARAHGNVPAQRLAEQLILHALNEEDMMYPAALLVGEFVRSNVKPAGSRR